MKKLFSLLYLVLAVSTGFTQQNPSTDITSKFERHAAEMLQEKLFVHIDKSFFISGEILWFKVYYVDASHHYLIDLSKVAYVEVLDNNNVPVLQTKVALSEGLGDGSLILPTTLPTGYYTFRAYTNWMKNFSADYFFNQSILIVNPIKAPPIDEIHKKGTVQLQFFPEGGNLIEGLKSKVAFRLADTYDMGIDCTGMVVDQNEETVATFRSLKFGIGSFYFTPVAGKSYKAIANTSTGITITESLPAIQKIGYVIGITAEDDKKITVSVAGTEEPDDSLFFMIHGRQTTRLFTSVSPNNGSLLFTVNKELLLPGINHITLFKGNTPVCERLYFLRPQQQLAILTSANKKTCGSREQIKVSLNTKDLDGNPQLVNMSLSVFRNDSLQEADNLGINGYLLLSSDLRGRIQAPDYYFSNSGPHVNEALDNIMLTHGWRRFTWQKILKDQQDSIAFPLEFTGHIITAKVTNVVTGSSSADVLTYMSVPGSNMSLYATTSKADGSVRFITKDFFGRNEIILQSPLHQANGFQFTVQSPFSNKFSQTSFPSLKINSDLEESITSGSISMQVQNIFYAPQSRTFTLKRKDTIAFYGIPDGTYSLDDYTRFTTLEEVLKEYVPRVLVRKQNGKFRLQIYNKDQNFLSNEPMVLIDGVPVADLDRFMSIDPMKLKKLDVISDIYLLGPLKAEGVISFISYKGDLGELEPPSGAVVLDYEGMQYQREFYSPNYSSQVELQRRLPDFRNVLYWSPNINSDSNGKAEAVFYTSDQPGKYKVVVQGITKDGKTAMGTTEFEVTKPRL